MGDQKFKEGAGIPKHTIRQEMGEWLQQMFAMDEKTIKTGFVVWLWKVIVKSTSDKNNANNNVNNNNNDDNNNSNNNNNNNNNNDANNINSALHRIRLALNF